MSQPLVTIGITAFNAADTVERAIRSALAQTWRPIEVVVVDDASSDGTPDLLRSLAEAHPELVVVLSERNGGVGAARNRIIEHAQGEFLVFFDDDDESDPERIERQVRRLTEYERDHAGGARVICHAARRLIYPDGREQVAPTMGEREGVPAPAGLAVAERILLGRPLEDAYGACPTCAQLARTSTYRDLGCFDANFRRSEDTEFNIRLAKAGGHFVGIGDTLVTQTMTKTSDKSLADEHRYTRMLIRKHRDVADRHGLYTFCCRWLDAKQLWLEGRRARFAATLAGLFVRHPLETLRRLLQAAPNRRLNRAFSRFHRGPAKGHLHG